MRSLIPLFAVFVLASSPARAQVGALYRCPANEYTNMLSAADAGARGCAKIARAEWVVAASDSTGRQYEYNDRRTVVRGNGLIETWLQVIPSPRAGSGETTAADLRIVSPHLIRCATRRIASGAIYLFDPRDNTVVKDTGDRMNPRASCLDCTKAKRLQTGVLHECRANELSAFSAQ